jgi:NTP pyrophosphatase (non-canonical NTP hydrolase)
MNKHDENMWLDLFNEIALDAHTTRHRIWGMPSMRNKGEYIGHMHSELSEAFEALRLGNPPDDKIPQFSGVEAEFADVIIQMMEFCHAHKLNLAGAILAKTKYNSTRPSHHGGKLF